MHHMQTDLNVQYMYMYTYTCIRTKVYENICEETVPNGENICKN